jgi:hypothetical protein
MALGDGKDKKAAEELNKEYQLLNENLAGVASKISDLTKNTEFLDAATKKVAQKFSNDLTNATNSLIRNNKELLLLQEKQSKNIRLSVEEEKKLAKLQQRQNKDRKVAEEAVNNLRLQGVNISAEQELTLDSLLDTNQEIADSIASVNDESKENLGVFGLISENAESIANSIDKTGTLSKLLNGKLRGTQALALLAQTSFLAIVKGTFDASQNIANIAKNTGLSADSAKDLQTNFAFAASNSEKLFITSKGLNEAFLELSKQTGLIADFGGDTLITQATLTKQLGLSAEQAGNLSLLSRLQSKDTEGVLDNTVNTVGALVKQSGVAVNVKGILEEISNTSAAITVSLGKNPEELAKAAVQAKLFGANLSTVDGIASSLLNFEESIANELAAELLIDKDINLEKARLLALNNDLAGLSAELADNEEIINAFATGNRIQQEAAAKALGLSREELAKISLQQDYNNLSAEQFKDTYGDVTYQQLQSQSAGEKFASVLEKIQGIVGDIGIAFSPILDAVATFVGYLASSPAILMTISGILGGLATKALVTAIGQIFASSFALNPIAGTAVALAGAGLLLSQVSQAKSATSTADDMISTGYGDRILSTPKGSIALNNQDTVVAGTNLGGGNNESKRTNTLLERILNKQGTVKIDSTRAGTAFAMGTYQVQ